MAARSEETNLLYRVLRDLARLTKKVETLDGLLRSDLRDPDRLIGLKEAAAILGVSDKTLRRMVSAGEIKHAKERGRYRFSLAEVRSRVSYLNTN
ncbi:MAG: helix-turn-helix domain-containing protein [Pseudoflavonifractor sp.]|nr:helix-turn-helix domain-containing protein [Alloprevotella sp.]MCM1117619.1 helix-turn-helix domain-containing protein [Pseudoflavonifractor sp.]